MSVYIVFGDNSRVDGDNILGVFLSMEEAEDWAYRNAPTIYWRIQRFEIKQWK